jgi:hypothetical protein
MELVQQYLTIVQPTGTPYKYRESPFGSNKGSLNNGDKEIHFNYTWLNYYQLAGGGVRIRTQNTIDISMIILLDDKEIYDLLHFGYGKSMILNTDRLKGTVYLQHIDFHHSTSGMEAFANITFRAMDDFQLL